MDERRSKLSPEKQALLTKRLGSLAAAVAKAPDGPLPELPPTAPAAAWDPGRELARAEGAPPPVSPDLWRVLVETGEREARTLAVAPDLMADADRESQLDEQAA